MSGPNNGLSRTFDAPFENDELAPPESTQAMAIFGHDLRIYVAEQALSTRCTESAGEPNNGGRSVLRARRASRGWSSGC